MSIRITAADAARVRELHQQGATVSQLAEAFGVSTTTVQRTLRYQLHCPPSHRAVTVILPRQEHARLALRAEAEGVSLAALCARVLARAAE